MTDRALFLITPPGMDQQPENLGALIPTRLTGDEHLRRGTEKLPLTVCDFWQWSASDLVSNAMRGRLAEFIVASALEIDVKGEVRGEWDACDLITPSGIRVEVKSSAYIQSWRQKALSSIQWRLGPTREWVAATNEYAADARLQADVYVFALFHLQKKGTTYDSLDLAHWSFFVVPMRALQAYSRKVSLTLKAVNALAGERVTYEGLFTAVNAAYQQR